jgi:uncharacterized membrane protein
LPTEPVTVGSEPRMVERWGWRAGGQEREMHTGRRRWLIGVGLVLMTVLAPLARTSAQSGVSGYKFIDLGRGAVLDTADPYCSLFARGGEGVSDAGIVVGQRLLTGGRAVPATTSSADGTKFTELDASADGGSALDINASSTSVGKINVASDETYCGDFRKSVRPVAWTADGERIDLPTGPYANGRADAINDDGQIVGLITDVDGEVQPARWVDGAVEALPLLRPDSLGGNAYGINGKGVIVGSCFSVDATGFASDFATVWRDGAAAELDLMKGTGSVAYDINDKGLIVGSIIFTEADGTQRQAAIRWKKGAAKELPTIPGAYVSVPFAVNNTGDAVGMVDGPDGRQAVAWLDGELVLISDLVPDAKQWIFLAAKDISDDGTIVGYGAFKGDIHAFVLRHAT